MVIDEMRETDRMVKSGSVGRDGDGDYLELFIVFSLETKRRTFVRSVIVV